MRLLFSARSACNYSQINFKNTNLLSLLNFHCSCFQIFLERTELIGHWVRYLNVKDVFKVEVTWRPVFVTILFLFTLMSLLHSRLIFV